MQDQQYELPAFETRYAFPKHLGLVEAAALYTYHRVAPDKARFFIRDRKGDLVTSALDSWVNISTNRFGDDLTRTRLQQMVGIAYANDADSGITELPSGRKERVADEKRSLDDKIAGFSNSIDWSVRMPITPELAVRDDRMGPAKWYNALDLAQARQAVSPLENPADRVTKELQDVLLKQFKAIYVGRSVYNFSRGISDPSYAPLFTFAQTAEDRFLSAEHALTVLAVGIEQFNPGRLNLSEGQRTKWFREFSAVSQEIDTKTLKGVKRLVLLDDWLNNLLLLDAAADRRRVIAA